MFEHRNKALPAQTKQTTSSQSRDHRMKARVRFKQEKHNPTPRAARTVLRPTAQAAAARCLAVAALAFVSREGKGETGLNITRPPPTETWAEQAAVR